ncbi:MAG: efflux RND transporter periplasmic adaptor subunit [Candidatus Magasanikiibacteriota bacterium]
MNQEIVQIKKKKWYKRKSFYIILVIGLVLAGLVYSKVFGDKKQPQYEMAKVEKGTLTQTVDATGNVESSNELELRFESMGKVAQINKQVGDQVKKGEVIMSLDLSELGARVSQASASVAKAQASLDKLLSGQTDNYLITLKAKVDQAEAALNQVKASYDDQTANAQAVVDTAKVSLDLYEGGNNSKIVENSYDDMLALLNSIQNTLATALTGADNILGIDNTFANDDFEDVLSALNSAKLNIATNKYYAAKSAKVDADQQINSLSITSEHEKIDWAVDSTEEALLTIKELMFAVTEVLDNTMPIGDLTQTELGVLKTEIQTNFASVNTKYSSLITQKQAIDTAKNSYASYKIAYDKALANLDNLQKKKEADMQSYQALLDQAQSGFNDAKNPPRIEDVASYEASLNETKASLSQAVANLNKARIIAPIDGVIGKVDAKLGQYVSSQDAVVKLVNPHFEIKVDIPETDIVKIALGNEAQITLDAFGDDTKFKGIVTEIEIGETVIQDVVYYSVTLSIDDNGSNNILNGMTANVMFYTEQKENVLYIPSRAIKTDDQGNKTVRILENEELKDVKVNVGLRGDDGLIEIVSGLGEGQEIVVRIIE